MTGSVTIYKRVLGRKVATLLLLTASIASFATLGDGGKKSKPASGSVLMPYSSKNFSLRSNYNYKGKSFAIQPDKKQFITLNTVVTYQSGSATYIMPLKKMALMGKVKFISINKQF